jgi:hypothetical protein
VRGTETGKRMTNEELLKIERRVGGSVDAAALILEIRLAWRMMDQVVQARVDQDAVLEGLQARIRELEAVHA